MNFDKATMDHIIEKLHIQPVGQGYIDMICPKENIELFIEEMNALGVKIYGFTWWCLATDMHSACGAGGPRNKYGDGWYSEILPMGNVMAFESNEAIRRFLVEEYPKSSDYKPCYHPGFWLAQEEGGSFLEKYEADMITYVQNMLEQHDTSGNFKTRKINYSRFAHTLRVYKWMQRLYGAYPHKEEVDFEALSIATIFHDIGYCDMENPSNHAANGAIYCREYLQEKAFPGEKIDFICELIAGHSDKKRMHENIPVELVLLMEADLLDDTGAQGLVMDAWLEAVCEEKVTFESILAHMERFTLRIMQDNPMRTAEGIRIWKEKRALTEAFVQSYREDLRM